MAGPVRLFGRVTLARARGHDLPARPGEQGNGLFLLKSKRCGFFRTQKQSHPRSPSTVSASRGTRCSCPTQDLLQRFRHPGVLVAAGIRGDALPPLGGDRFSAGIQNNEGRDALDLVLFGEFILLGVAIGQREPRHLSVILVERRGILVGRNKNDFHAWGMKYSSKAEEFLSEETKTISMPGG